MKNIYLSLTIIFVALAFVACTPKNQPAATVVPALQKTEQQTRLEVETNAQKIAKAMERGGSVRCEISKEDGSDMITFLVKGKKTKAMGNSLSGGKGVGYMINDGEYAYMWNDREKQGIKMSMKMALPSSSPGVREYEDFSKEDVEKQYEEKGYSYSCKEVVLADSEFVPPTTVTFTDMSKMMEQSTKMMQDAQSGKKPSAEDMKQYEEMMKNYQQEN